MKLEVNRKIGLLFLLIISLGFVLSSCRDDIEPGAKDNQLFKGLEIATAKVKAVPELYEAVGTVMAENTSELAAKLMARVERIAVKEGDRVNSGDVLVYLDQRQVLAGVKQAEASLAEAQRAMEAARAGRDAAKAAEELAAATFSRYQTLRQNGSISAQQFDEVDSSLRQAKAGLTQAEAQFSAVTARVEQAKAALSSAQVTLKDTMIGSPYSGVVADKHIEEGDMASPGRVLLTMETTEKYRLYVEIPEVHIKDVDQKQDVKVEIPARGLNNLNGVISTIVPAGDPGSRSFLVKIDLPEGLTLKTGMFGKAKIKYGSSNQMILPGSAIIHRGQLTALFIVGGDGVVHFRLIRLGRSYQDSFEVLTGISDGERYVVKPPPTLVDGARILSENDYFPQSLPQAQSRFSWINPLNTKCIPVVNILTFLDLAENLSFSGSIPVEVSS
ncbi:Secretion protein, HlyD family [uncultured Desulfobacterium sp.]|uniref:Secretion protein, HlyD family n=1 Tax=uncultured Desulfobacterium sp. TaxID=201089 RepID=A0A445MTP2_9BACT|nr:Secretion protein, HlyD family [uncultured Desulfobacterium sp.]